MAENLLCKLDSITNGTLHIGSTEVQSELPFTQLYNSFSYRCNSIPNNGSEISLN